MRNHRSAPAVRSRNRSRWPLVALLFGLCFAQGIFYIVKIGNLYVDIIYPIALVILLVRVVLHPEETERDILRSFDRGLLPFFVLIVLSLVLVVFTVTSRVGVQVSSYVNGIVVLAASVVVYMTVLTLRSYVNHILQGLWIGLLINVAVSLAQYVAFQNGSAFTLYNYFPQPAFYISVPWEAASSWASNAEYLVYSFRAQGLYLECSYFVAGATMIYIATSGKKQEAGYIRLLVLIILIVLFAMSNTGNIVIFIASVAFAHILRSAIGAKNGRAHKKRSHLELLGLISIFFLTALLLVCVLFDSRRLSSLIDFESIVDGLIEGVEASNIAGGANDARFQCMSNAISEFLHSPLGVGYNMASSVLSVDYGTNTTFSYVLTLLVELGIPGLVAYGYFVIRLTVKLLGNQSGRTALRIGLAVAIIALAAFQAGNGSGLIPMAWCLFALAAIEISPDHERAETHEFVVKGKD